MAGVAVVDYDPRWPALFATERANLERALGLWLTGGIHHIGSTAIPGLSAKPILDIIAGVRDLGQAQPAISVLSTLGYVHAPHRPRALWFYKPPGTSATQHTYHLHLTEPGSDLWRNGWRSAMRCSPIQRWPRSTRTSSGSWPYTSLDPRQTAEDAIDEVLRLHHGWPGERRRTRVAELTELVGLDERQARALPRALSGGQRQRVAIARALAAEPRILILDESVAALDVSIQAQVLNLLADIRDETGVSYVLISHDLAVVRQLSEEVIVLHAGRVVERGPTARVLDDPQDSYTKRLRASVPRPGWKPVRRGQEQEAG